MANRLYIIREVQVNNEGKVILDRVHISTRQLEVKDNRLIRIQPCYINTHTVMDVEEANRLLNTQFKSLTESDLFKIKLLHQNVLHSNQKLIWVLSDVFNKILPNYKSYKSNKL